MASPTETAVRTFEAAWNETDPARRAALIEACLAVDGRIISKGQTIRGRAELATAMDAFRADPRGLHARIVSAIDAQGSIFRFRAHLEARDGQTIAVAIDTGEVDADGRISVLITFAGELA